MNIPTLRTLAHASTSSTLPLKHPMKFDPNSITLSQETLDALIDGDVISVDQRIINAARLGAAKAVEAMERQELGTEALSPASYAAKDAVLVHVQPACPAKIAAAVARELVDMLGRDTPEGVILRAEDMLCIASELEEWANESLHGQAANVPNRMDGGWDAERAAKARAELLASISSGTKAVLAGIRNNWNAPNEVVAARAFRSFVSSLDPEEPITPDRLTRIADELDT